MKNQVKKIARLLLLIIEKLTNSKITITQYHTNNKNLIKSSNQYLSRIALYFEQISNFRPKNIFEIGANYGQDADFLKTRFGLSNDDIYIFEPHPEICKEVKEMYKFNCFDFAVSDKNETVLFHAIDLSKNNGISSCKAHMFNDEKLYKNVEVRSIRMDYFILEHNIESIDFLKIDVEGLTYEVLSGFGEQLHKVKAMQIETEFMPVWSGQRTWEDVYNLLLLNNFQLVDYILQEDGIQADSFWIQAKLIKHKIFNISTNKWEKLN